MEGQPLVDLVGLVGLDRTGSSTVAVEELVVVADSTVEPVVAVGRTVVAAAVVGTVVAFAQLEAVDNHIGYRLPLVGQC